MKKIKNKFIFKILIHVAIIICSILLIESFVCNYKHFLSLPSEEITYQIDQTKVNGLVYDENEQCYVATRNNPTIELLDINEEVKTIYFDITNLNESIYQTVIDIYYTDETRINYVAYGKDIEVIPQYENSKYIQEDFFGKTEKLKFTIKINKGDKIDLGQIGINHQIPFNFSFVRVFAMLLITMTTYLFVMGFKYKNEITTKPLLNKVSKITVTVLSMALILLIYGDMFNGFANALFQTNGTQISKELVDSFLNGQVSMLEEPTKEFLAIEDPYVPANRKGHYLWDHVLFDGKYYSYYGIFPVIILFLPFKLITNYYFYDGHAVLLFSLISTLFIAMSYFKLIKKKHPNLPLFIQISGYIILFMSCGVISNIVRPAFYEVATSCAFMCMSIAIYHLVSSNLLTKDEKINYIHTTCMTSWLSFAVLSRATVALYAICGAIIIVIAYLYRRKSLNKKDTLTLALCGFVPFIVFGSVQCIYNYLRFNSIFEFGIKYSLTINDFTKTQFKPSLAFNSFYNFLFAVPKISDEMYFVKPNALTFGASGYYFFETYNAMGLFIRVPMLFVIFALPFMKSENTFKDKVFNFLKYGLPCVIMPIIIVIITWESGFAIRYYSDFAWAMVLFALFVFFDFYEKCEKRNDKSAVLMISIVFAITLATSFIGQMAMVYDYIPNFGRHIGYVDYEYTYKYFKRARELSFWY